MIYSAPVPFQEALDAHAVKSLLPTTGKTYQLQQLKTSIKQRALWSATVAIAEPLQRISDGVDAILAGETDQATVRLGIKQLWQQLGYQGDAENPGSLQDLTGDARINLQIETNVATARNAGWYEQGQQPDVLDEFPAQELYRVTVPQGGVKAERDWASRWAQVGGQFFDGRMIALKTDLIWDRLGDPANFPDGLGNPYPPFAFNSGMRVRDVDRDEAESLGLLKPGEAVTPQPLDFNADLQASPDVRSAALRAAMEETGLGHFEGDTFLFDVGGAAA